MNTNTILFAGDSITQGSWTVDPNNPFHVLTGLTTAQMFSTLIGQAKGYANIINMGKSGDTAAGLLARLSTDVIPSHAAVVVVMIGRNDVGDGVNPITSITNYQASLTSIAQALIADGSRVVFMSWNAESHAPSSGTNSPTFLDAMAQVAESNGCGYIDIFSMWCSYLWGAIQTVEGYAALYYEQYTNQPCIHPSALGAQWIATFALKPQFNLIWNPPAPVVQYTQQQIAQAAAQLAQNSVTG